MLDGGINLIDTSIDYGRSEELIGRYLGHRRDDFFLASKCGCLLRAPSGARPPFPHDYSPGNVRAGVEQSLRRLDTDRLDLVQVHMSPSRAQMEADDTVETLQALRDEGKVRFIGMSGILPNLPDQIAMGVFEVFQIPYSAVQREHEDLSPPRPRRAWGPSSAAARGAAPRPRTRAGARDLSGSPRARPAPLGTEAEELLGGDMNRLEFVLRFTLSHPALSSTIVGTSHSATCVPQRGVRPKRGHCPRIFTRRPSAACPPPQRHDPDGVPRLARARDTGVLPTFSNDARSWS